MANVAVTAARNGAHVALASGAGDDPWGRWLRTRLETEGVGASLFALVPASLTPVSIVAVNANAAASYQIYGETISTVIGGLADRLQDAIAAAAGLYCSSNTLVGEQEREVTMRARDRALALGRPVVFDPDLRLERWRSRAEAAAASNARGWRRADRRAAGSAGHLPLLSRRGGRGAARGGGAVCARLRAVGRA